MQTRSCRHPAHCRDMTRWWREWVRTLGPPSESIPSDDGKGPRKSGSQQTRRWRGMDSNFRFLVTRPSNHHGRQHCFLENGSGSVGEPKVRIHLPPAASQVRTSVSAGSIPSMTLESRGVETWQEASSGSNAGRNTLGLRRLRALISRNGVAVMRYSSCPDVRRRLCIACPRETG